MAGKGQPAVCLEGPISGYMLTLSISPSRKIYEQEAMDLPAFGMAYTG
jgi:hypothetical protein